MYIFDTNIIIYYFDGIQKAVSFLDSLKDKEEINISVISKIELLSSSNQEATDKVKGFLAEVNILSFSDEIVDKTIEVRRGFKLKLPDAIIAATALVNGASLVTHNRKDFERVEGLETVDPLGD